MLIAGQPVRGGQGDHGPAAVDRRSGSSASAPSSSSSSATSATSSRAFIEEALRLESPIKGEFRLSRVPATVGERRPPRRHHRDACSTAPRTATRGSSSDPHEFRLDRVNGRQHLGFGFGIHTCAGAPLARAEARVTIERFLDRMADIRISEARARPGRRPALRVHPTYMLRGLEELHLEFTPADRAR